MTEICSCTSGGWKSKLRRCRALLPPRLLEQILPASSSPCQLPAILGWWSYYCHLLHLHLATFSVCLPVSPLIRRTPLIGFRATLGWDGFVHTFFIMSAKALFLNKPHFEVPGGHKFGGCSCTHSHGILAPPPADMLLHVSGISMDALCSAGGWECRDGASPHPGCAPGKVMELSRPPSTRGV